MECPQGSLTSNTEITNKSHFKQWKRVTFPYEKSFEHESVGMKESELFRKENGIIDLEEVTKGKEKEELKIPEY